MTPNDEKSKSKQAQEDEEKRHECEISNAEDDTNNINRRILQYSS